MVSPGDNVKRGYHHYIITKHLIQIQMERTLIRRKSYSLKLIKNTVLFGFSYDKPQLFIAFICFVIEIDFTKSKKAPNKY